MKRVLLVEDDRRARESLAGLLRQMGHEVRACGSAEDAADTVGTYAPDVALLDIHLPGVRGDDFAASLQTRFPATQIIFVSGENGPRHPERFGQNVSFMPKPVDFPMLIRRMQQGASAT